MVPYELFNSYLQRSNNTNKSMNSNEVDPFKLVFSGSILGEFDAQINDSKCSQEYGGDLIRRWQRSRIDVCAGFGQSSITCYKRDIHDTPKMFCTAENAQIETANPFYSAENKNLTLETKYRFNRGFFKVDCKLSMYQWVPQNHWEEHTLGNFFKPGQIAAERERLTCEHVVTHPVFWMARYDEKNAFHFMEDVEQIFEAFLVLREDPFNAELVAYDGLRRGTALFTLWPKIFGRGVRILRTNPFPKGTCFTRNVFNMWAGRSLFSNNKGVARKKTCKSAILKSLRYYLLNKFGLWKGVAADESKFKILFVERKNYAGRAIHRVVPNLRAVVDALKERLRDQRKYSRWSVRIQTPEDYPTFQEQLESVHDASVLIGVHGAGLEYIMFMPQHAHLIELYYGDRAPGNNHFYNICQWLGIKWLTPGYLGSQGQNISADKVWAQLVIAMDNINSQFPQ